MYLNYLTAVFIYVISQCELHFDNSWKFTYFFGVTLVYKALNYECFMLKLNNDLDLKLIFDFDYEPYKIVLVK